MDPAGTRHQLTIRILGAFAGAITNFWLTRLISKWIDPWLTYRLVQALLLIATSISATSFLRKLDVHRQRGPNNESILPAAMAGLVAFLIQMPFRRDPFRISYRVFLLVNNYLFRKFLPAVGGWMDQQTSDIQSLTDIGIATMQILLYLAPGRTLKWFVVSIVLAYGCFFIGTTQISHKVWPLLGAMFRWLRENLSDLVRICDRFSLRYRFNRAWRIMKEGQFRREQERLLHLPEVSYGQSKTLEKREIRLLKLLKKRPFNGPEGKLFVASVDTPPLYEAISHAWEYPVKYVNIRISGGLRMQVPSHVYDFLCHRRSYFSSRLVWIDAISIDQENPEERADQVQIMKDVFGNAEKVVVWMAATVEAPDAAAVRTHLWWLRSIQAMTSNVEDIQLITERPARVQQALWRLLENRWFTRCWMLQEIALAKQIHILYGSTNIEWWELHRFASVILDPRFLASHRDVVGESSNPMVMARARSLRNMDYMSQIRVRVQNDQTMGNLARLIDSGMQLPKSLGMTRREALSHVESHQFLGFGFVFLATVSFDATDARDKIFALLGTVTAPSAKLPTPDYRSSYEEVYFRAMKLIVASDGLTSLTLMCAGVGLRQEGLATVLQSLPSWVPNYTSHMEIAGQVHRLPKSLVKTPCVLRETTGEIELRACFICEIEGLGDVCENSMPAVDSNAIQLPQDDWSEGASAWLKDTKAFVIQHCEEKGFTWDETAFWRTIFTNRYANESPMSDEVILEAKRSLFELLDWDGEIRSRQELRQRLNDAARSGYSLYQTSLGRRFGISRRGEFLLTPPFSKQGDVVCLFEGLEDPFLLRHVKADRWQLVGSCYVDRFEPPEAGDARFQDVLIV